MVDILLDLQSTKKDLIKQSCVGMAFIILEIRVYRKRLIRGLAHKKKKLDSVKVIRWRFRDQNIRDLILRGRIG
jgi:hypothetical protein